MKKLLSLILCAVMCIASVSATAADTALEDDFTNQTGKYVSAVLDGADDGILLMQEDIGPVTGVNYLSSGVGTAEIIYKLDSVTSFEVQTFEHFRNSGTISFAAAPEGENGAGDFTAVPEADIICGMEKISNVWNKATYYCSTVENASYIKIIIDQKNDKRIRISKVKLLADIALELEKSVFYRGDAEITDGNLCGADKLVLTFNQRVETIPQLSFSKEGGAELTADGKADASGTSVVYSFGSLDFSKYSFSANGFESPTKKTYDYSYTGGMTADYSVPESVHFGEEYSADNYITVKDAESAEVTPEELSVTSKNTDVIDISENAFVLKKAGKAVINAAFKIGGESVSLDREITLCGAEKLVLPDSAVSLSAGESKTLSASVELTDGTTANVQSISLSSADNTIASTNGAAITGVKNGATFVTVKAGYYGAEFTGVISVGVGREPLKLPSGASIAVNRTEIAVGESVYAVLNAFYADGSAADALSAGKAFFSDNPEIISVDADGKITAAEEGTAHIRAELNFGGAIVKSDGIEITAAAESKPQFMPNPYVAVTSVSFGESGVTAVFNNSLGRVVNGIKVVIIGYDENGSMTGMFVHSGSLPNGEAERTFANDIFTNAQTVKVHVWNSL